MKPLFVGIGLALVGLSGVLAAVGHYDGVLGTTDPDALLEPDAPKHATIRIVVLGTTDESAQSFDGYRTRLVLPQPMKTTMDLGPYVSVRIQDTAHGSIPAFLHVRDFLPAPGTTLVVKGIVETYYPLADAGRNQLASTPVLFVEPDEYHEPILFKA